MRGAQGARRLRVIELDGSPSGFPHTLKLPNGSLTDNGDGSWTYTSASAKAPLGWSLMNVNIATGATYWIPLLGGMVSAVSSGTEAMVKWTAPHAGTLRNFRLRATQAGAGLQSAGTLTVVVYRNGVAVVSLTRVNTDPIDSEDTDAAEVAVAAGDALYCSVSHTLGAPDTISCALSCTLEAA